MTPIPPYVVLLPDRPANPTDRHLVVHVDEWVQVRLGEKELYTFSSEHDTYESAASERDGLNHRPLTTEQPWPDAPTSSPSDAPSPVPADAPTAPATSPGPSDDAASKTASALSAKPKRRRLSVAKSNSQEAETL